MGTPPEISLDLGTLFGSLFVNFGRFWGSLGHPISTLFLSHFFDYFLKPSGEPFCALWAPFGLLFGVIFWTFLGSGVKVKIELPSTWELSFQGLEPPKIDAFSEPFLGGPLRSHFC